VLATEILWQNVTGAKGQCNLYPRKYLNKNPKGKIPRGDHSCESELGMK
jgi:hypothetical protein